MSAVTTIGGVRRGPRMRIDLAALRRHIGDRPWDHLERDAGLAKGQIARIFERGGVRGDVLDDLCGALGIHESEVLADMNDFPALDTTPVRLDGQAVHRFAQEAGRLTDFPNAKSDLANLAAESTISVRLLQGFGTVPLWKVESLSVLLGCLPGALIAQGGTMPESTPKKAFQCDLCERSYDRSQDLGVHRKKVHGISGPKSSMVRTAANVVRAFDSAHGIPLIGRPLSTPADGPDVPCDEACEWAKEGYAAPPAGPDLRFEVIHTRLRLIAAVCEAEDVSARTRELIFGDLMRVRSLVDELEAERA